MLFLFENSDGGNSQLKGRKFPIPDGIKEKLINILNRFQNNKGHANYQRLNNIITQGYIDYNELKMTKSFFDNFQGKDNSIDFQLNGGSAMKLWANMTLNSATNIIKNFKDAKKVSNVSNAFIKPHTKNRLTKNATKISTPKVNTNTTASNKVANNTTIRYENIIRESDNYHVFYDYISDYDAHHVLNEFVSSPQSRQNWGVLIDPNQYQKALAEFTQYGRFMRFPSDKIYQWMGIIMKNTAMLMANTEIAGHTRYYPTEEVEDVLIPFISNKIGEEIELNNNDIFDIIDMSGILDWMIMPDGSDAWSDFGLEPIQKIIIQYNQSLSPEKVIVLINKILDVSHQRGDLPSIFIKGGSQSLTNITYRQNESKTIILNASQVNKIVL